MNTHHTEINRIIEKLYSAQANLAADNKQEAAENLSCAFIDLSRIHAAVNNEIHPEGDARHIKDDADGMPVVGKPTTSGANDNSNTIGKQSNELDDELAFLKANLPGFDENELYSNYRRGLQYAIVYLANLADANAANSADVSFDNCDVMKLTFRTDSDLIKRNSNLAKEHLAKLFSLAGFKFAEDPDFSFSDGVLTVVFSFEKVKKSVNCYRISPLLMLADIFGLI